jgi:hypothetical protein
VSIERGSQNNRRPLAPRVMRIPVFRKAAGLK